MASDNSVYNNFSSDGSFMEKFRQMQEKKKSEADSAAPPPKKAKPVVMKLSSLKKKKNPFLAEPIRTKNKAFSKGEGSDDEDEDPPKPGEEILLVTCILAATCSRVLSSTVRPKH